MLSSKDRQGIALIGAVVLVLVGLVSFNAFHTRPKPDPDNCVGSPEATTAIVIDRSDDIPQQTLDEIRSRALTYVRDSVRDNERVSIFTVSDSSALALAPILSVCRPPQSGNRLIENVKNIERAYHARFQAPLDSALRMRVGTSGESPIAQALTDLSLSKYLRSRRNTLIVFSDMLENTPRFSLYRCAAPDEVVQRFRASRVGAQERPAFRNTMVKLNIIPRLGQAHAEIECRDKLWTWFFGDDTGSDAGLDLDYLPGGPPVRPRAEVNPK